jgi:hypothetical protein
LKLKIEASSRSATILAVVTSLGGLVVGLAIVTPSQEGILIAVTTSGIGLAGLLANAIHNGMIEPSAIVASVGAVVGQAVSLAVSFLWITEVTAQHVVVIVTAVVLAVAQVAHALISRQVSA